MVHLYSDQKRVLIVDDHTLFREGLAFVLRGEDYAVQTARDGGEAIELLRASERPDLILLDMAMPGMDGWDFLQEREEHEPWRAVPVVLMTGDAHTADWARQLGALGVLRKPFQIETALQTIREHTGAGSIPARN